MYLCARGINVASFLSLARSKSTKGQTMIYKAYTENKKTENRNLHDKPGHTYTSRKSTGDKLLSWT
jgi:hypothetical protein